MNERDKMLFGFPLIVAGLFVLMGVLLLQQITNFESGYRDTIKNELYTQTQMVLYSVRNLLQNRNFEQLKEYCQNYKPNPTRITLIDANGAVIAESQSEPEHLDNHADRPEIRHALEGKEEYNERYSASERCWMLYHTLPIQVDSERYVLRVSVGTSHFSAIIQSAYNSIVIAMLFGITLLGVIIIYILERVRRPLKQLQECSALISEGNYDVRIPIPNRGPLRGLAVNIRTMTDQLRERIHLLTQERNERDQILDTMSEPLLILDSPQNVFQWNAAAAKLFEISSDQKNYNLSSTACPDLLNYIQSAFTTEDTFPSREITYETTKEEHILFCNGTRFINNNIPCVLLCITDITNIRKLESFRRDFVANVSHEIKTPITCIMSAIENLEMNDGKNVDMTHKCLDIIKLHTHRLNALVQDILSLAAIEQRRNHRKETFSTFTITTPIYDAIHICSANAEAQHLQIHVEPCDPIEITGDQQLIEQALINLITNAIKYSQGTEIFISCVAKERTLELCVRDNGIGIAPIHHERIFERFYRVHQERNRASGGTGLGLAIVKHIAQLHGGNVALQSEVNQGCTFTLTLARNE